MTAILGYTELLRDRLVEPEVADAVAVIERNGQHLLVVLNDILDLSKIEAGRLEFAPADFALAPMLLDAVALLRSRAEAKGLQLEVVAEGPIPRTVRFAEASASGSSALAGRKNKGAIAYRELAKALLQHWRSGKKLPNFEASA